MAILIAAGASGCGSQSQGPPDGADTPDYSDAVAKAPPDLGRLYADGDAIIDGGQDAYEQQLEDLRGYPVVVNNWASWCGPCRQEFPYFQALSGRLLDRVAFLGVVSEDSEDAASTFLDSYPVPYPSVADPDGEVQQWIDKALVGLPNTFFYDSSGALVYVKQGPYGSESELEADLRQYAMAG